MGVFTDYFTKFSKDLNSTQAVIVPVLAAMTLEPTEISRVTSQTRRTPVGQPGGIWTEECKK